MQKGYIKERFINLKKGENITDVQKGVHTWAVNLHGTRMSKAGTAPVMAPGLLQMEDCLIIRQRKAWQKRNKRRKRMKKKLRSVLMTMIITIITVGCGAKGTGDSNASNNTGNVPRVEVADSAEVLNKIWDTYGDEEKFFAMGGDFGNPVDNSAGIFNIEDTENLTYALYIPSDSVGLIDEAASLIHGMNANTFTGAVFHLKDTGDAQTLADALRENIVNTQWICGFPDRLAIYTINGGEYVISAFGKEEIMENFKTKLMEAYGQSASMAAEEKLV